MNQAGRIYGNKPMGERNLRHGHMVGHKPSPTYVCWASMIERCTNPNHPSHTVYGGAGISVCDRWRTFANFLADMGERPAGLTLDRYPNRSGNYEPGNVRWASRRDQARNTKRCRPVRRSDGVRYPTMADAADAIGGNQTSVRDACLGRQRAYRGYTWEFCE